MFRKLHVKLSVTIYFGQ